MKLADILARELESWPEGFKDVGQAKNGQLHLPGYGNHVRHTTEHFTLADDWRNAVVTYDKWQSARDKLKGETKVTKPKGNKDGWIRHRGGKCPVDGDLFVDVRRELGSVLENVRARDLHWDHDSGYSRVMAYRLHAPDLPSESMEPEPGMISFGPLVIDYKGVEAIPASLKDQQVGRAYRENPLQWRDRIKEIDSEQKAADDATKARYIERAELVAKLKSEGLALISEPIKAEDSAHGDMGDWRNWLPGDLVECVHTKDAYPAVLTIGKLYTVSGNDGAIKDDEGHQMMYCVQYARCFKWHSRPSKP